MSSPRSTCPECGAAVAEARHATTVVLSCSRCSWTAATTNENSPPFDPRRYAVFPSSTLPAREVAVRLAVALGLSAKDMLAIANGARPIAAGVDAVEVQRLAGLFAARGIAVRTEPAFPWGLPRVEAKGES